MGKKQLFINRLLSGGLITNYYCTSECGHCLYCCSPRWEKRYIDRDTASKQLKIIKSLGCRSIHIGGGEPFLNPSGLQMVMETARETGMGVDYIETNSSWCTDTTAAGDLLAALKNRGLTTLLISMSPFHNEHIPFSRVKNVIETCRAEGINAFPWVSEFYTEIDSFDDKTTHKLPEYSRKFGADYLKQIPSRVWTHFGGRALRTFSAVLETWPCEELLSRYPGGCRELADVSHFHLDLFGSYIPGLCSGLAVEAGDLGAPLSSEKYPILTLLFHEGIRGFAGFAEDAYGFKPSGTYLSKCHLCNAIRSFFVTECEIDSRELKPVEHYSQRSC